MTEADLRHQHQCCLLTDWDVVQELHEGQQQEPGQWQERRSLLSPQLLHDIDIRN